MPGTRRAGAESAPGPSPTAVQPPGDLVELGAVRGAYGVKGWVRVAPHDAEAAVLTNTRRWWLAKNGERRMLQLTGVRRHGAALLAKWRGCETPEAAEALKGALIEVSRADFPALPAGEVYWVDLIGAQVQNRAGVALGTVQALRNNGVHDLLQVAGPAGELLIPLVDRYVDEIDAARQLIRVDWELDWS